MSARFVTIDLGNSRCKLVVWERAADGAPRAVSEMELATMPVSGATDSSAEDARIFAASFSDVLARLVPRDLEITAVAASSVAAPAHDVELRRVLRERFGARFLADLDCDLDLGDLPEPARVGRDRLFAARGAFELVRASAIVVDAGTALTVDALVQGAPRARFLGGSIAPGPFLLADALARHAARLPRVEPQVGAPALGRDTHSALQAGIVVGFRGAAAELARSVARASGLDSAPVVVTGGARAFLLQPASCFDAEVVEDRLLVHRGLLSALLTRSDAQ